ncbi:DNA-directed RNA polymerase sigma subunit (sigma70/sigma32) [Paenibacillus sp. V4I7]|nr:DNA-directed RNA polymerase sigma subunit (sigma70/sigma32) [Paenibacillus sp. V4I7]
MAGIFSAIAILIKQLTLLVSYVKNNAFPQPLTEAEEETHLRLMAEGNDHSRNKLIEHNLRLVAHIVKRLWTRNDVVFLDKLCSMTLVIQEDRYFAEG